MSPSHPTNMQNMRPYLPSRRNDNGSTGNQEKQDTSSGPCHELRNIIVIIITPTPRSSSQLSTATWRGLDEL